jgi:hypothetical protein
MASRTTASRPQAAVRDPSVSEEVMGGEERKKVVAERSCGAAERAAGLPRRGQLWEGTRFEVACGAIG